MDHQRSFLDDEFNADMAAKKLAARPAEQRREELCFHTASDLDLTKLNESCRSVAHVLSDGQWHSASDIIQKTGFTESMRRLRELRAAGVAIEKRGGGRAVEYRLRK